MAEPDRTIHTETDMAAYEGYMPDEWGETVLKQLPEGTVQERLVMDLAMSWRSTSYTAQMPVTSIRAMHAAALGRGKFVTPDSSIVTYSERILGQLCQRVPELVENGSLRARLIGELANISTDFRDRAAAIKFDYPVEPIWAEFMAQTPFRMSLWASQRVAYVAFYNAYESFLVDCVKQSTGAKSLRTQSDDFKKGLRTGFVPDIAYPCWFHNEINTAKLIRHALSHNGGRETEDLKKVRHGVILIGDELQIVPEDNHRMLRMLRKAVEEVITATSADPKFLASAAKLPVPNQDDE